MGDLTWLTQLGPSGLLALTVGMILLGWLVPRSALTRERQISAGREQLYLAEVERGDRALEIAQQQMTLAREQGDRIKEQSDLIRQLATAVGQPPLVATEKGRHHRDG